MSRTQLLANIDAISAIFKSANGKCPSCGGGYIWRDQKAVWCGDDFHETAPTEGDMAYDIEAISAAVHDAWMENKRKAGVSSRKLESGEELMVPYEQLSEQAKELDRGSVRAVVAAIESLG